MSPGRRGLWRVPCHLPESVLVRGSRGQASWLALQRPGHVGEDRRPLKLGQQGPDGAPLHGPPGAPCSQTHSGQEGLGPDAGRKPWPHRSAERLPSPPRAPGLGTALWGWAQEKARR